MYTAAQDQTTSKQQTYKSRVFVFQDSPLTILAYKHKHTEEKEKKASELN